MHNILHKTPDRCHILSNQSSYLAAERLHWANRVYFLFAPGTNERLFKKLPNVIGVVCTFVRTQHNCQRLSSLLNECFICCSSFAAVIIPDATRGAISPQTSIWVIMLLSQSSYLVVLLMRSAGKLQTVFSCYSLASFFKSSHGESSGVNHPKSVYRAYFSEGLFKGFAAMKEINPWQWKMSQNPSMSVDRKK